MQKIYVKAYGKINLGLDVLRKREDGYHDLRMIMQTVGIYDGIEIRRVKKSGIHIKCNVKSVPTDESNLVYKAAKLLMDEFNIIDGLEINIEKVIPVAAGMAGGSSDCAATLVGINRMFNIGLSESQLRERGVKLGADVPYCIMGGTALAEGIGEKLTKLTDAPACKVLLVKPPIGVSTGFVYGNLKIDENTKHPDIDVMLKGIEDSDYKAVSDNIGNVLESVTIPAYPIISEIKEDMLELGADNSLMSGSGPTVFGLFTDEDNIAQAYKVLSIKYPDAQIYVTELV
ncbi:4-(cytidine 5'-diphospho)-2-C-methyl-D-erythritol kinase [uncultured Eubacterium sp.]|uniref:4-(cytidine 5'-diphospho)-2-C-methyl-D-erythritol kinase n=1 Tax=uncultured Eubacterium sp. TaxID=165185 RepID=UPI000EC15EC6|nr:4-(cytidine 5'-diphospho)-2-C-methyl-D-erythritol kinase [uncultured Eubacterium sp.]HAH17638.1 4-(cytidine 5'-diphospho)-2-C-methyl-D-erythritol kinase [Eubacterium sp.]